MTGSRISTLEVSRVAAEVGLYVLFPGFFFYHLAVTGGLIPSVVGGLFGPATVILTVVFLVCAPQIVKKYIRAGKAVFFAFGLLFFYCLIWFLLHHYTTDVPYRDEAAEQVVGLLFSWFALFVTGVVLPAQRSRFRWVLSISICLIVVTTLLLFNTDTMMFNPRSLYDFSDGVATYQGYARSALLTALFLLGVCSNLGRMLLVFAPSAVLLFLLGARSELFGFVALGGVLSLLEAFKSIKRVVALLFVLGVSGVFLANHVEDFMASRQSEVLDLDQATSWQKRREYQAIAFKQIIDSPVIGMYAGHFEAGGKGAYAHNATSAWVEFGAFGFVLYVGLTVYCAVISYRKYRRERVDGAIWRLSFYINFVALLLVVISKPVFWTIPALGWGLVVSSLLRERSSD